jgi:hypothetical protein
MSRSAFFLVLCLTAVIVIGSLFSAANRGGEGEQTIDNTLAVQKTLLVARDYLQRSDAKKAVELLEANLERVNGDRKYLALLRDAYRSYIKDLSLARQSELAEVYQKRLKILEDYEASHQAVVELGVAPVAAAPNATPSPASPPSSSNAKPTTNVSVTGGSANSGASSAADVLPASAKGLGTTVPGAAGGSVSTGIPGATGGLSASSNEPGPTEFTSVPAGGKTPAAPAPSIAPTLSLAKADPFETTNEIPVASLGLPSRQTQAKNLMAMAQQEFAKDRWASAKELFEQVYKTDPNVMTDSGRTQWAYCQLQCVAAQVNNSSPEKPCDWTKLEGDVKTAMAAAPSLAKTGEWVLGEMAKARAATPVIRAAMPVPVTHKPRGDHGWLLAETTNFRIFHDQKPELAESVAQAVEAARSQMARKWLGKDSEEWTPKCDIYLHANGVAYSQHTGQNAASPGHSRIELDRTTGRVVVRQIHVRCDNQTLLNCILPHETTHIVLAGQFGNNKHVPRWIDEGIAVLTEPSEKVQQHRANLVKALQAHKLIPMRDLLELDAYPAPNQVATFYGQSVGLVDFLTQQKGPVVLMQFGRDALQMGYEPALKKHYGYQSLDELRDRFHQIYLAGVSGDVNILAGQ